MTILYWVGGTGSWSSNPAHWSVSSGGVGGASAPNQNVDVVVDASSGSSGFRIGISVVPARCHGFDCSEAPPFLMQDSSLWPYGDVILGTNFDMRAGIVCSGVDQNFRSNGCALKRNVVVACSGSLMLEDAFFINAANSGLMHRSGSLNSGGFGITCGLFALSSPSGPRELYLDGSTITLSGQQLDVWNVEGATAFEAPTVLRFLPWAPLNGKLTINGLDFRSGGFAYHAVEFDIKGATNLQGQPIQGVARLHGGASFASLSLKGKETTYTLDSDIAVSDFIAAADVGETIKLQSDVQGITRTIAANFASVAASVELTDVDIVIV